ncbi:MAG: DpnD/PcfM family protein [Turicibacter sp.]|nr:DpnD/PcfM family protein [Turicibacter sp.]
MSHKLMVCITETLERLIEVEIDDINCDPIEYIRQQYLDEEIILDANDAWLSLFFANFNSNCAHGGGYCHHGYKFIIRLHFIVGYFISMKCFIKILETIDNKKTYLNSESPSVLRYVFLL